MKHTLTFFPIFTEYMVFIHGTELILSILTALSAVKSAAIVAIRPRSRNRCNLSPVILFLITVNLLKF